MNNWKNKTGRPRPGDPRPPRSSSMYGFQNMGNVFPPSPRPFSRLLSTLPTDVLRMEIIRLIEERKSRSCETPEWRGSSWRSGRYGAARSPRGHRSRPDTPDPREFSPCRPHPQFYQPQFYHPLNDHTQMYGCGGSWLEPLIEESSSNENLTPCRSCQCCRYFIESILDIVGRSKCYRSTSPLAQGEHRIAKNSGKKEKAEVSEPERDASDESSDGETVEGGNSARRTRPEFGEFRGSGDERVSQLQTGKAKRRR